MKISAQNLANLIREAVKEELGTKKHAAFGPDKRLKPDQLAQALGKLRSKKKEREEEEKRVSAQKKRTAHKNSMRGMHIESGPVLDELEQANGIPDEVMRKAKDVAKKYLDGHAHWMSLEDVYYDMVAWTDDPMNAVTALYNELNKQVKGGITADLGPVPDSYKRKIQKAYGKLTDLAFQERQAKSQGL